jgi:murein DD-endopeptidase MepM/ murein hydrolase activator NlpD
MLARISLSLDKVEQKQAATLTDLEERIDTRSRRMHSVLSDLGVNLGRASADTATGGPFVPARPPQAGASSFERQLYRINVARAQIDRYNRTLLTVPVRKPIIGEVDMSSPFGMRMDPFVKGPAIHTGIDLRGDTGDPVRATANGRVAVASWQGDYGKMVEIDHGNGLSTRYGHMSAIDVKVGDQVRIGQTIGKIGSTGRSTGPHLHYETRINDEAVDPQRFGRDCGSAIFSARDAAYSTSSTFSGPPPNAFCASAACMNSSRSPSSTPAVFDEETPVRKSFTI